MSLKTELFVIFVVGLALLAEGYVALVVLFALEGGK